MKTFYGSKRRRLDVGGPHQWQYEVVDRLVVEALGLRNAVGVLGGQPAGERGVGGAQPRVLSEITIWKRRLEKPCGR